MRKFLIIIFCLNALLSAAQHFIDLPAAKNPLSAALAPHYTTQISVTDSVGIAITFPEYQPVTPKEQQVLKKYFKQLGDTPEVKTSFGKSRKEGLLDISIFPFIKRDKRYYRLVSFKLELDSIALRTSQDKRLFNKQLNAASDAANRYAPHSVLATGKWVKIHVGSEGIYELSATKLKEMGFADINRVKLFGYGGRVLPAVFDFSSADRLIDDLEEVPLYRRNGSVLFYAEGTVRKIWSPTRLKWTHKNNTYARYAYYFVTEGEQPLALNRIAATQTPDTTLDATISQVVLDDDAFCWYEGGTEMYDSYDFANGATHAYKLNTPFYNGKRNAEVEIAFGAAAQKKALQVNVQLNNSDLGTFSISRYYGETESARETRSKYSVANLKEENTFNFSVGGNSSARLNYISISYARRLDATDQAYAFLPATITQEPVRLHIANATKTTQVWQIGRAKEPLAQVAGTLKGNTLEVDIDDSNRRYIIVDVAKAYPAPSVDGQIENQDLHADGAVDMVIIIPQSGKLLAQAERLAEAHKKQGLRVKVVRADQLYNEYSSGTPDVAAYRRYMKMLYDRAQSNADMPRYLVLFGDCLWDNRMLTTTKLNAADFLLAYEAGPGDGQTDISIGTLYSYVTDDYFGMLDDGEGNSMAQTDKLDLGIGRFMCYDAETAKMLVDKTIDYLENKKVGNWKNKIVMIADNGKKGENNLHTNDCENVIRTINAVSGDRFNLKKVYPDAYTYMTSATGNSFPQVTKMLREEMNRGALIFNYTGHGSPIELSQAHLLATKDYELPTQGNLPLWIFASCEVTPFDQQTNDIGRAALYNKNGGAMAVICASRSVFANYNRSLNVVLNKNLLSMNQDGAYNTMGEAMRLTKIGLLDGSYNKETDRSMNKLKYTLLGDPALPLMAPRQEIVLDSINGAPINSSSKIQLKAGEKVRFSGHVIKNNAVDTGFSGVVTGSLHDRKETITCKNNGGNASEAMVYTDWPNSLYEGSDSVKQGCFTLNITIPHEISYSNQNGRLSLYAVDNTRQEEAHGFNENFFMNGSATTTEADSIGPKIFIYLNTPDFPNGGYVKSDALLIATLSDSAGINTVKNSVGHALELVLDNQQGTPILLNDYFSYDFGSSTSGIVTYPLEGLTNGKHRLSLRAWDINDNSTTAYLDFIVSEQAGKEMDVNATQNPAKNNTLFITTIASDQAEQPVTTEVYDVSGRLIWSASVKVSGTYATINWDLTNSRGAKVNAGIYIYRSLVNGKHTKAKKMIVLKQ